MNPESLSVSYGISSAVSWGAGDFSGGFAARRCHVLTVVLFSQLFGAVFLLAFTLLFGEPLPPMRHMLLGGLAGVFGVLGLMALYKGLASGRMGIVAPLSAVITAMLPIVYGFFIEGIPEALQVWGFGIALIAVWLLSHTPGGPGITASEIYLPLAAGIGFGLFFIFIDSASRQAVLWPLIGTRAASLAVTGALYLLNGRPGIPRDRHLLFILLAGIFDVLGNAFFAFAAHIGRLDISATLSSLYPAATVMLAWIVLKERLLRRQWLGVFAALVSLGLISS